MGRHVESEIPGEALLNHTKDICKVTLLESVQETLHITTSRKQNIANGNQMEQKKFSIKKNPRLRINYKCIITQ